MTEKTAAVIVEPIQGEGGVRPLTPAFAAAVNDACARTGALLIADEVQSGCGRTGYPFYSAAIGLKPHLMALGKALGAGVPVGATLVSSEVATKIMAGDHGTTYGGNLLACRAALCFIDELVGGGLLSHVGRIGAHFEVRLRELASRHSVIKEVRGAGRDARHRTEHGRRGNRAGGPEARRRRESHGRERHPTAAARTSSPKRNSTRDSSRFDQALGDITGKGDTA